MGMKIYGIGCAENPDNIGETLLMNGVDTSNLNLMRDEHSEDSFFRSVGAITYHKKIFREKDCENDRQLRCWRHAQVPFLYAEGEIADEDHPNAQAAAAMIRFTSRPDISPILSVGWSVDGGIIEKRNDKNVVDENGKILAKTQALALALTHKPCNPKCKIFLMNDLTKSDLSAPPPDRYWKALKQAQAKSSFRQIASDEVQVYLKLNKLKKSLTDYFGAFTSIRCKKCGSGTRFFKSSSDVPNGCPSCKAHFNMSEIWQALNKST